MFIEKRQELEDAILALKKAIDVVEGEIEMSLAIFLKECREERKAKRKEIALANNRKQRYSPAVLTYRVLRGNLEITWSRIWYLKNSNVPRYKRIPVSKGSVHLARLKSGAHEDEVALIQLHEVKARAYRELNSRSRALFHGALRLHEKFNTVTGADFKPKE